VPAPLKVITTSVKWRVNAEDLLTLRDAFGPGHVNEAVRALIHAYCNRLRREQA